MDHRPQRRDLARRLVILAVFPENVRADAMQDQEDQEPLEATAAAGQVMIDTIVERTAKFLQDMIDGTEGAEIPPFMP